MPELEDPVKEALEKWYDLIGELSDLFSELFDDVETYKDLPYVVAQQVLKTGNSFGDLADVVENCWDEYDDDREGSEEQRA